jgi:hypothetical protein
MGDQYNLTSFRNDILGGLLGAAGGKLGEELLMGAIASQVAGKAAQPTVGVLERAGLATVLAKESGEFTAMAAEGSRLLKVAQEGANLIGSSAGTTIATGENAFTLEGLAQNVFMNQLGKIKAPKPSPTSNSPQETIAHETSDPGTAPSPASPELPGSSGHSGPGQLGTVSERLEARRVSDSMEQLASRWPEMTVDERLTGLAAIGNRALAARGVPHVKFVDGNVGSNDAYFDCTTWTVVVSPKEVLRGSLSPELAASLGGLSRHEVDHTMQWWEMARLQADQGKDAATIQAQMHIPAEIAEHAVAMAQHQGPMGPAQRARAQAWWAQVYGALGPIRNYNLEQLEIFRKQLKVIDDQIDQIRSSGNSPDPNLLQQRAQIDAMAAYFYTAYRSESIEQSAYRVQGIVGAEAQVMEAQRQLDFAELAVREVNGLVQGIEAELLPILTAGNQPNAELLANHQAALERLKKLQDKADELRLNLKIAEKAVSSP